jgi:hypothetical protein
MLLALLLLRGCAITAQLQLLLLAELLCKLLDFSALLHAMTLGVVHQALQTTLVVARGVSWPHVTTWAMGPTSRCSGGGGSGCTSQWLVLAAGLLLFLLFVAALNSGIYIGLASLPYL